MRNKIFTLSVLAIIALASSSVNALQSLDDEATYQQKLKVMVEKITSAVITNPDNFEGHITTYDDGDEVYSFTLKTNIFAFNNTLCQRNRSKYSTHVSKGTPIKTHSYHFYEFMKKDKSVACEDVDHMVDFGRFIQNPDFIMRAFDGVQAFLSEERVDDSPHKELLSKISFKDLTDILLDWDELAIHGRELFTATFINPENSAYFITVGFEYVKGEAVISKVSESTVNI